MPLPQTPSAKLDLVVRWLTAFETWDVDAISALSTDDFQVEIFPSSLGGHKFNKEQFLKHLTTQLSFFTGTKTTILDVVESADRLFVHTKAVAIHSGTTHESAITFNFAGDQVSSARLFLDAGPAPEFRLHEREG